MMPKGVEHKGQILARQKAAALNAFRHQRVVKAPHIDAVSTRLTNLPVSRLAIAIDFRHKLA